MTGNRDGFRQATPMRIGWRIEELHGGVWMSVAYTQSEERMTTLVYGGEPTEAERAAVHATAPTAEPHGGSRRAVDETSASLPSVEQMTAVAAAATTAEEDQEQARLERLAVMVAAVTSRYVQELTARGIEPPLVAELALECAGHFWERENDQLMMV